MTEAEDLVKKNMGLYVCVGMYFALLVIIAIVAYSRKRKAASVKGAELDAHFGGSFGAPLLVLTTFSTVYSGFTVTGVPSEAFHKGFTSLRWIGALFGIVMGMLIVFPRLRRLAVIRNYQSPSDFVSDRYRSRRLRLICAVCAVLPLLIYMSAQVVSFASMASGLTAGAVSKQTSMVVFVVVILAMEKLGGMNSVVLTDAVQSVVMIAAFMAVPFVLGVDFGWLWQTAPADCPSLRYVFNTSDAGGAPAECSGPEVAGCVPTGCLAAVRPEFYDFPTRREQCSYAFFVLNMIAYPLQPHIVQRAYIASSDRDLKIVVATMLLTPFLAQPPGILMGLVKATYERAWLPAEQQATAFAAVSEHMMSLGPFEYILATVMSCSSMAAIMSTADSLLMGASSLVSMDIYKGVVNPEAPPSRVVRLGEMNSVLMASAAAVLGSFISVASFGKLLMIQNGLLMQLAPAYFLGLFTGVRERSIFIGIITGIVALVVLFPLDLPWEHKDNTGFYVPKVNIPVAANLLVVGLCELFAPGADERPSVLEEAMNERFGHRLTSKAIRGFMHSTREPPWVVLSLMGLTIAAGVPLGQEPGSKQDITGLGLPTWAATSLGFYIAALAVGLIAVLWWAPKGRDSGYDSSASSDSLAELTGAGSGSSDAGDSSTEYEE